MDLEIVSEHILGDIPSERVGQEEIRKSAERLRTIPLLETILDAIPFPVMILNAYRQIVLANSAVRSFVQGEESMDVEGLRPGEFMKCVHSGKTSTGCGSSEDCRVCKLVRTVLESRPNGTPVRREVELTIRTGSLVRTYEFDVTAAPLTVDGESFTFVTLADISEERRRKMMERIFFHDVINLAGGLKGLLEVSRSLDEEARKSVLEDARLVSENLLEEIAAQKELISAETEDLEPTLSVFSAAEVFDTVIRQLKYHPSADGRKINISPSSKDVRLLSDRRQLVRVLVNMLKNALEEIPRGGSVDAWCEKADDGTVRFSVRNDSVIRPDVQRLIFRRSFSTKGASRGTGTWSMKLLTEKFLKGRISFVSTPETGTIFTVEIPKEPRLDSEP